MSAYVVGKEHIDALVRLASEGPAGYHGGPGGAWGGYYYVADADAPIGARAVNVKEDRNRVGQMLVSENVESVWHRYPDDKSIDSLPGPVDKSDLMAYVYERGRHLTAIEGLVALSGYEYQSCEHPGWRSSEAYTFVDWLRGALIHRLPGYAEADTWEVTTR
jgi:hypothetical protein